MTPVPMPLTPEFCCLLMWPAHPEAGTAPLACCVSCPEPGPSPPSCPGMVPRQQCRHLTHSQVQMGSSWYLEPQQALVQAPQQPLRSPATASSHLTLLLGHTCCAQGLSCFLLAACTPSRELGFQAVLLKHWMLLREGAGLAGRLPARRERYRARLFQALCKYCSCQGEGVLFFFSSPAPKPFPKYSSQDHTAAVYME